MLDGEIGVAFTRSQNSQVVPGIGQGAGIAGRKFEHALKAFPCIVGFLLLQVGAAQAIESFGALRVVLEGLLEKSLRLFEIAVFEKNEAQGKIVSRKVKGPA